MQPPPRATVRDAGPTIPSTASSLPPAGTATAPLRPRPRPPVWLDTAKSHRFLWGCGAVFAIAPLIYALVLTFVIEEAQPSGIIALLVIGCRSCTACRRPPPNRAC